MNQRRLIRVWIVLAATGLAVLPPGLVDASPCWLPPTSAPVVDPFRQPACRWCPGNRGIEYGTRDGDAVRAAATGTVTFSGTIGGTTYVVVQLPGDLRVTYGSITGVTLRRGDVIVRGTVIGAVVGHLHFGLRDGDAYIDPAPFLGSLTYSARLIPVNGDEPASPHPPELRCVGNRSRSG